MISRLIRWYRRKKWWKKEFQIVERKYWIYSVGRCVICHAGNPNILCGEDTPCPCKWNECLKKNNNETAHD